MEQKLKRPRTHMAIPWHDYVISGKDTKSVNSALSEKSSIVGRVGLDMLKCGTPAWRARQAMVKVARALDVVCVADIGISTLNFTCMEKHESYTMALSIEGISVNMHRLSRLYRLLDELCEDCKTFSVEEMHQKIDSMENEALGHSMLTLVLAAAFACAALAMIMGASLTVIVCVFISAAVGQFIRKLVAQHGYSLIIGIAASAAASCVVFAALALVLKYVFGAGEIDGSGYICSVLFLVPGFPFITSILDFAKLDMRSGIERITYATIVMLMATLFASVAMIFAGFENSGLAGFSLSYEWLTVIRTIASFVVIAGFSLLFNSSFKMAALAGLAGMFPNVIRLVLVEKCGLESAIAAYIMALLAGLLASIIVKATGYPRIAITVPSVVVAVPGYIIYQAVYNLQNENYADSLGAIVKAIGIILALGLGVVTARYFTDPQFRHRD